MEDLSSKVINLLWFDLKKISCLLFSSAASGVQGPWSSKQFTYAFKSLSVLRTTSMSTLSYFVVYLSSENTSPSRKQTGTRAISIVFISGRERFTVVDFFDYWTLSSLAWRSYIYIYACIFSLHGSLVARITYHTQGYCIYRVIR